MKPAILERDSLRHVILWVLVRKHSRDGLVWITKDKTTIEHRYYIASIENDATLFGKSAREHWGIENGLHWCLDIGFREDECRIKKGQAAENHALLNHIALNALKREKTSKVGIQAKRHKAGWDE